MIRPILFLDVDGVLNSTAWARDRWPLQRDPLYDQLPRPEREALRSLDPYAVVRLSRVVDATDCLVVVGSTWRKSHPLTELTWMLRWRGFEHRLFAATPDIWHHGEDRGRKQRGGEIHWWLDRLGGERRSIAIVDDDSDMEPYMDRLVLTDHAVGITDDDADRLIELLRQP